MFSEEIFGIARDGVLEATSLASRPAGVSLALALASEAKSLALALASGAKSLALALNLKSLTLDVKLSWPCWSLSRYCAKFYDAYLLPSTNIICTVFASVPLLFRSMESCPAGNQL